MRNALCFRNPVGYSSDRCPVSLKRRETGTSALAQPIYLLAAGQLGSAISLSYPTGPRKHREFPHAATHALSNEHHGFIPVDKTTVGMLALRQPSYQLMRDGIVIFSRAGRCCF